MLGALIAATEVTGVEGTTVMIRLLEENACTPMGSSGSGGAGAVGRRYTTEAIRVKVVAADAAGARERGGACHRDGARASV